MPVDVLFLHDFLLKFHALIALFFFLGGSLVVVVDAVAVSAQDYALF